MLVTNDSEIDVPLLQQNEASSVLYIVSFQTEVVTDDHLVLPDVERSLLIVSTIQSISSRLTDEWGSATEQGQENFSSHELAHLLLDLGRSLILNLDGLNALGVMSATVLAFALGWWNSGWESRCSSAGRG